MFWSQNVITGSYFMLISTDNKQGPGNPSAPIGFNAFRTTNFGSWVPNFTGIAAVMRQHAYPV